MSPNQKWKSQLPYFKKIQDCDFLFFFQLLWISVCMSRNRGSPEVCFPPFNSTTCRQGGMANIKCRKRQLRSLWPPARDNRTEPPCLPFDHTECQWNLSQLYRNHKGNRIKVNTRVRKMSSARDTGCFVEAPLGAIEGSRYDQSVHYPPSLCQSLSHI